MASGALVLPEREWTPDLDWKFNRETGEHDQSFYLTDAQEVVLHGSAGNAEAKQVHIRARTA
jgi:hypothetical protein